LQLQGTAFRKNITNKDIPIGVNGEVIPPGAFVTYHLGDIHLDPTVYRDPEKWDPSRYFPDRAEDKKKPLSYLGWGVGRHPCRESPSFYSGIYTLANLENLKLVCE
jgi:cytochrome P450